MSEVSGQAKTGSRERPVRTGHTETSSTQPVAGQSERERRAALRRRSRRRMLIRRWVTLGILVALLGLGYTVIFTPALGMRSVQVSGTRDLTQSQIVTAAAVVPNSPMLTLDLAQIRDRIAALPRVAAVDVFRSWPSTVRIAVTERTPLAVLKTQSGVHLVDNTGKDYVTVSTAPSGLPELRLAKVDPADPVTQAVMSALVALPDKIRADVQAVSASSASSVVLNLSGGREVRWGSQENSSTKAAKLAVLLTQKGKIYDVSSPDLPTIG